MKSPFERARWSLEGQKEAADELEARLKRDIDWSDPEDVAEWRRLHRLRQRERLLPRDRKCPKCRQVKVDSRQWVALSAGSVCLACWRKPLPRDDAIHLPSMLLQPSRWSIDAAELVRARELAGISRYEFARQMRWSYSYQCKLESGLVRDVAASVASRILEVLSEWNVYTQDITR